MFKILKRMSTRKQARKEKDTKFTSYLKGLLVFDESRPQVTYETRQRAVRLLADALLDTDFPLPYQVYPGFKELYFQWESPKGAVLLVIKSPVEKFNEVIIGFDDSPTEYSVSQFTDTHWPALSNYLREIY